VADLKSLNKDKDGVLPIHLQTSAMGSGSAWPRTRKRSRKGITRMWPTA
jgi:hypothetical protein